MRFAIGIQDKNNRDILIGSKIKHPSNHINEVWEICFGEYNGDNYGYDYRAYGTYMKGAECSMPLNLDILLNCEIIN